MKAPEQAGDAMFDLGRGGAPVDRLLSDFFKSELPQPWPAAPVVRRSTLKPAATWWTRSRNRIAVAAAVVIFFAGYGLLSWTFPQSPLNIVNGLRMNTAMDPVVPGDELPLPPEDVEPLPEDQDPVLFDSPASRIRTPGNEPALYRGVRDSNGRIAIEVQGFRPSSPNK